MNRPLDSNPRKLDCESLWTVSILACAPDPCSSHWNAWGWMTLTSLYKNNEKKILKKVIWSSRILIFSKIWKFLELREKERNRESKCWAQFWATFWATFWAETILWRDGIFVPGFVWVFFRIKKRNCFLKNFKNFLEKNEKKFENFVRDPILIPPLKPLKL